MNPPRKKQKLGKEKPGNARPLSAIAARRAALQAQTQGQNANGREISQNPKTQEEPELFDSKNLGSVLESYAKERPTVETTLNRKKVVPDEPMLSDDEGASSSSDSGDEPPEIPVNRPSVALSTFKPSKENVKELKNGGLLVRLSPGERLVILGQYEMTVQKGEITLLGATLTASKKSYTVYSPSSHSLPVIRCSATDIKSAEICFQPHKSGLETLQDLSPLFGKLWNEDCGPLGPDFEFLLQNQKPSTYQILFPSLQNPPKSHLQPLISPPEWNALLSRLSSPSSTPTTPQITLITGPKSSGKSTFARLLTNKLLSTHAYAKTQGLALLDLDPGQPEYSLPGNLSLTHLRSPNFGTPYTHPRPSGSSKTIRMHALSAITPSMDTSLYMACAMDLYSHYRKLLSSFPKCPLVVNTPGWVLGTGLEILVELIASFRPTEVLYMSCDGPQEVVESLREACGKTPKASIFHTLPSQSSEFTTRTAAHLRTMQYMSYFHLNPDDKNGKEDRLSWNNTPLTSMRPWEIKYSGENSGIWGIMCYGEQPPPSLLAETINGSLLSLVVSVVLVSGKLDIPGWSYTEALNLRDARSRSRTAQGRSHEEGEDGSDSVQEKEGDERGDGFKTIPWVEKLEGSQGRGIGSRVWRVRRDLGRMGDGE
ncbi:hypothetical protein HYFRA_00013758 [Hymenoscyphus fraxineus]|uniref:Polynucleotide 5'-hydroxyl-kinase GRC3 n=1 Tax=Hymenoscyphus fraxineus TaxID=746836 RepID=A0A9N9Q112_9HELO|nr:hypothetical protein HYFRA_00013758 [Hymenoscyphus fraxineus]